MKKHVLLACFALFATFFGPRAAAQSIICDWLDTGTQPSGIAVDNQGDVFVALFGNGSLVEFGPGGCSPTTSIGLPNNNPNGVALDGSNNAWVTLELTNLVVKINLSTHNETLYTVGSNPRGVIFDGTYIWVANYGSNSVTKLLPSNGANLGTFPVGSGPYFLAYHPITQTIWVANRNSANVTVLNQNGVTVNTIATGSEPQFVAWDGGNNMWVSCYSSQLVEEFSASGALVASYAITGHGQPLGISFGGGALWGVTHNGAVFFIANGVVHYASPIGANNYDSVYDPTHNVLWVTDLNQGIVIKVSPN